MRHTMRRCEDRERRSCCYFFTVTIKIIGWLNWKTTAGRTTLGGSRLAFIWSDTQLIARLTYTELSQAVVMTTELLSVRMNENYSLLRLPHLHLFVESNRWFQNARSQDCNYWTCLYRNFLGTKIVEYFRRKIRKPLLWRWAALIPLDEVLYDSVY
jgi:hypothetical protein